MNQVSDRQIRNATEVDAFLENLKNADWLDAYRRWWPRFLYHFTDVRNAVSILERGALFSRIESLRQGVMATDNASQQVLSQTSDQLKNYVRLYFRPRTPTQYRNEGFRPISHYWQRAHCPMPIHFLFDSMTILIHPDGRFSDGNLASPGSQILSATEELNQMPFRDIYHDKLPPDDEVRRQQIVTRRQAEVIVPNRLDLTALRFIICRSQAERESLLHLLTSECRARWQSKIRIDPQRHLFLKQWLYVESVELSSLSIVFHFNLASNPEHNGPFRAVVSITDMRSGKRFTWESEQFTSKSKLLLDGFPPLDDYSVEFSLDDQIAYAGRYQVQDPDDLPW